MKRRAETEHTPLPNPNLRIKDWRQELIDCPPHELIIPAVLEADWYENFQLIDLDSPTSTPQITARKILSDSNIPLEHKLRLMLYHFYMNPPNSITEIFLSIQEINDELNSSLGNPIFIYLVKESSRRGNFPQVSLLLNSGVPCTNLNYQLSEACALRNEHIALLLLEKNLVDTNGKQDALSFAAQSGLSSVVLKILKCPEVNPAAKENLAIKLALDKVSLKNGQEQCIALLLTDIRVLSTLPSNIFSIACKENLGLVMKKLLECEHFHVSEYITQSHLDTICDNKLFKIAYLLCKSNKFFFAGTKMFLLDRLTPFLNEIKLDSVEAGLIIMVIINNFSHKSQWNTPYYGAQLSLLGGLNTYEQGNLAVLESLRKSLKSPRISTEMKVRPFITSVFESKLNTFSLLLEDEQVKKFINETQYFRDALLLLSARKSNADNNYFILRALLEERSLYFEQTRIYELLTSAYKNERLAVVELLIDYLDTNTKQKILTDPVLTGLHEMVQKDLVTKDDNSNAPLSIAGPRGGIHSKYINGPLPTLPLPPLVKSSPSSPAQTATYPLTQAMKVGLSNTSFSRKVINLKLAGYFQATFHSNDPVIETNTPMSFILAGRGENAFCPSSGNGRVVLVLSEQEYRSLLKNIPENMDILVLKKIEHPNHGNYQNLSLPTARRLGIFLAAQALKIDSFIMLDDNIAKLTLYNQKLLIQWDDIYELMQKQLEDSYCVSVKTHSSKKVKDNDLGSKLFMINMRKLKKVMRDNIHIIFALFPKASEEAYWGEDYYFQVVLHLLALSNQCQGYKIIDPSLLELIRSQKNKNAFVKNGKKALTFPLIEENHPEVELINSSIKILNQIIEHNIVHYQRKLQSIKSVDLGMVHALANGLKEATPELSDDSYRAGNFIEIFKNKIKETKAENLFIPNIFRSYQMHAFTMISYSEQNRIRLNIATGAGKTFIQCELARIAYTALNKGEHVIIVTPRIDLLNQFYEDLIKFNAIETTKGNIFKIKNESIIKVSSDEQSCELRALLENNDLKNNDKKYILIFCVDSFSRLLEGEPFLNAPMIFLDEYHSYTPTIEKLLKSKFQNSLLIGSSATPPLKDHFKQIEFKYTCAQGVEEGYLAPLIADGLGVNYSEENVNLLIKALPFLLKKQFHPGFKDKKHSKKLFELKGIIYFPSIEKAKEAAELLSKSMKAFAIHSQDKKSKSKLKEFLASEQPGVLCAVQMLRLGFDDKDLAWEIIAQNPTHGSTLEQMLGRLRRLKENKIGYVLAFNDTLQKIDKLNENIPITFPVNIDYLAEEICYKPFTIRPRDLKKEHFSIASDTPVKHFELGQRQMNYRFFGVYSNAHLSNAIFNNHSPVVQAVAEVNQEIFDFLQKF